MTDTARLPSDNAPAPQGPAIQWRPAKLILDGQVLASGHVNLVTNSFRPIPWQSLGTSPIHGATVLLLETQQTIPNVEASNCPREVEHYHLKLE